MKMEVQGSRKRKCLDRVRYDITEKYPTVLHGREMMETLQSQC